MTDECTTCPLFRPGADDLRRIAADVAEVTAIQGRLRDRHPGLKCLDRAAHEYQVAGSKVLLRVASHLPQGFSGVGLFVPGATHIGVGRVSTSLGTPHAEDIPDFLGLRASFLTAPGRPVDFLGVSSPALPVDNRLDGMHFLRATADAAGAGSIVSGPMAVDHALMRASLTKSMGVGKAEKTLALIAQQSVRTARSGTAYQSYWTGVVEVSRTLGRFALTPLDSFSPPRSLHSGEHYLTADWARRQASGDIVFEMHWICYLDEGGTPLERFTQPWSEGHKRIVGHLVFPRATPATEEARLWETLAAEMAANPGNWVCDATDSVREPSTEFGLTRKLAYERSARGRDALSLDAYRRVLQTGRIDDQLAAELERRAERKRCLHHIDRAPEHLFAWS
jgi:hypothetical protein